MSERGESRPDFWPFEEPLDPQSIIETARLVHDAGESWPYSVAKALIVKRAGRFFSEPKSKSLLDSDPGQGIALVSYSLSLFLLTKIESTGRIEAPAASELLVTLRLLALKEKMPGEPQLEEVERNELLLKDATGITLLQRLLWLRSTRAAALSSGLAQTATDSEIIEPQDLENPEVQRLLPPDLAGRVQAVKEYRTIINSVHSSLSWS